VDLGLAGERSCVDVITVHQSLPTERDGDS
jgi:hypothetical protein